MKKLSILLIILAFFFSLEVKAESLENRLSGKILLQVESNGEAWYINPGTKKRHFMGRPDDAFRLMNELGVGISNENLKKIPLALEGIEASDSDQDGLADFLEDFFGTDRNSSDSDGDGFSDGDEIKNSYNPKGEGNLAIDEEFAKKYAGKIFLQVENNGEAWYLNPDDNRRYFLGRPADAFNIMRKLGLGIRNGDLAQITEASEGELVQVDSNSEELLKGLKEQKNIIKFASIDELSTFLKENHKVSNYSNIGMAYGVGMVAREMAFGDGNDIAWSEASEAPMADQAGQAKNESAESSDYSKTNIQVDGVDEADIVKTDGEYIYALSEKTLFIIEANPGEDTQIASKIEFEDRPNNLYIKGDHLVVFGQDYDLQTREFYKGFIRRNSYTFFKIYDLTDKTKPKEIKDLSFEGYYSNSRMIGDYVYFITNNHNYSYIAEEPTLPRILDGEKTLETECSELKCYNPDMYYFGIPYSSYNIVSINAINISNPEEEIKGDVYVLESGQEFYVSENNIYLTYAKYLSEYQILMDVSRDIITPRLSDEQKERIKKIEDTDNDVLSPAEKDAKISEILTSYIYSLSKEDQEKLEKQVIEATKKKYDDLSEELEKTVIHKIAIDGSDLDYIGNGEVTGRVLNQFSMDESSDGYFRIATTKGRRWSMLDEFESLSYNNLYILDKDLSVVGSVEHLAEDENIKSVRFMQDRAYMVTFKQVDPLYVIDVADPRNPKVLGELKMPGWSDYLHPYSDTMLIGLGKDAYENEYGNTVAGGVKISLFDVSEVSKPVEVDSYIIGESGSHSDASGNHKAFYYNPGNKVLAFPIRINEKREEVYTETVFNGAIFFDVSDEGFDLKGKITHMSDDESNFYNYRANISRIMHIEDKFYTLSVSSLKVNQINDLEEVKVITLSTKEDNDDYIGIPLPEPIPFSEDIIR